MVCLLCLRSLSGQEAPDDDDDEQSVDHEVEFLAECFDEEQDDPSRIGLNY